MSANRKEYSLSMQSFFQLQVLSDLYSLKGTSKILFLQMGLNVRHHKTGVYMWTFRIKKQEEKSGIRCQVRAPFCLSLLLFLTMTSLFLTRPSSLPHPPFAIHFSHHFHSQFDSSFTLDLASLTILRACVVSMAEPPITSCQRQDLDDVHTF